ncbi:MAG: rhodanese-like domain-containing protein [Deinococcales bacterium]
MKRRLGKLWFRDGFFVLKTGKPTLALSLILPLMLSFTLGLAQLSGSDVDYFGNPVNYRISVGFAWDTAQQTFLEEKLRLLLNQLDTKPDIRIAPAEGVSNLLAVADDLGKPLIIYNPSFVTEIEAGGKEAEWMLLSILAHEVGHHIEFHIQQLLVRKNLPSGESRKLELAADEFSGEMIYRLGGTLEQAQRAIQQYASNEASQTHPDKQARLFSIGSGWYLAQQTMNVATTSNSNSPSAPKLGIISIATNPNNATIYLDGAYFGSTPLENVPLALGEHHLRIVQQGFDDLSTMISISGDSPLRLDYRLNPNLSTPVTTPANPLLTNPAPSKPAVSSSAQQSIPPKAQGYRLPIQVPTDGILQTQDVDNLIRKFAGRYRLYDARTLEDYKEAHLPTSESLPYDQVYEHADRLPEDKNMLVVFYCWYETCGWSPQAAEAARDLGYQNVAVYLAGIEAWQEQHETVGETQPQELDEAYQVPINLPKDGIINLATLRSLMRNHATEFMLFDARDAESYDEEHLPPAQSLPYDQVLENAYLLPENKDMLIVFYCQHATCGLSPQAADRARELGYRHVVVFIAGIDAWKEAGYPVR